MRVRSILAMAAWAVAFRPSRLGLQRLRAPAGSARRFLRTTHMSDASTSASWASDEWPAAKVRQTFTSYFEEKHDHTLVSSSPVVPVGDPTLLFANAGAAPSLQPGGGKHRARCGARCKSCDLPASARARARGVQA